MGRKKTPGNRSKGGRLKKDSTTAERQKWDYGNDRVQARRSMFDCQAIKGGKAADEVHDGIGMAWAVGLLDGHGLDDVALRDAGRRYASLYWRDYGALAPGVAQYQRSPRGTGDDGPDIQRWKVARDKSFELLKDMREERSAVMDACVDPWFSDGSAGFLVRLVNEKLLDMGRGPKFCEPVDPADSVKLAALIRGLCLLVDGCLPQRRAA